MRRQHVLGPKAIGSRSRGLLGYIVEFEVLGSTIYMGTLKGCIGFRV